MSMKIINIFFFFSIILLVLLMVFPLFLETALV